LLTASVALASPFEINPLLLSFKLPSVTVGYSKYLFLSLYDIPALFEDEAAALDSTSSTDDASVVSANKSVSGVVTGDGSIGAAGSPEAVSASKSVSSVDGAFVSGPVDGGEAEREDKAASAVSVIGVDDELTNWDALVGDRPGARLDVGVG
jgi:hypothetical protein